MECVLSAPGGAVDGDLVVLQAEGGLGVEEAQHGRGAGAALGRGRSRNPACGAEVAENVGESEESEDEEWNYFRVKPTEQATDSEGALEDMESQLNPNAAVFVPSTPPESSNHIEQPFNENLTQEEFFNKNDVMSSSFIARDPSVAEEVEPVEALNGKDDEVWLSSSPKKGGVPLDNVLVPPEDEFDAEACQRPSDLDVENEMNLRNGEKPNIIEDTNPFSATDSILPQSEENNCIAADSVPDIVNDVGPVESQDADELVADAHFDCAPLSEPSAPIEAAQTLLEEFSSEVVPGLEAQNPLSNPFEAAVISPPQEEAFSQDANEAEILPSSVNLNFSQISEEGVSPSPLDDSVFLAPSEGTSFLQPEPAYTQDADRSGSPIVSGGATGFVADYDNSNQDFMMPPSQENNVSDLSSEPLNEGVVYSVSGFDNMMDAPSVTHNTTSPMMNDLNAQSTPFDANKFEFGVSSEVSEPKEPECEQVERNAFSQQVEAEVHSQFQQGDFIEDGVENNLNAGFVEIPTFPAAEKDGFEEGQMFATEHIPEATSPLPAAVEPPTFAEDVPERDVSNMEADFLGDLKQPSVEQRHELVEQMFEQEPSSRNQEVCLQFENESPAVSCDIPLDNGEKVPAIESQDFIEPTPAIHVNGFEEAISPDVNGYASQSPEIEVVYQKFSDEAQSTVPPCSEASEIPVDNNLQADPIPPVSVNGPAADVSSPVVASATGIAAAGAAIATGAAAAVAVAAAASKTDKKPASKEPVSKAKPSAGAKAPAKAPVKATSSSASAPKKPIAPVPAARAAPAPRTTTAPKPKPSETATSKPAVSARPAPPKPRTTVPVTKAAVTEKKPLTNGDAAKAATAKAPSRPLTRPATAPARTTARPTTTTSTAAKAPSAPSAPARPAPIKRVPLTTAAAPKPKATEVKPKVESKPTVGVASRPRPASAISSTRPAASAKAPLANKPIDKQTKETTNKLISATRSTAPRTAATSKPLASKTASSAATTTASSKAVPSKPAPIRRPASTTAVKSTVGKKAPITNGIVKNGQNGHAGPEEPVQNGVCHDEPVIEKRESDLKIESVDNQLVA